MKIRTNTKAGGFTNQSESLVRGLKVKTNTKAGLNFTRGGLKVRTNVKAGLPAVQ